MKTKWLVLATAVALALMLAVPGMAAADDDIGTAPVLAAGQTGTIQEGVDAWDCYKIYLAAGEKLSASLSFPAGANLDVYLYPPGTTSRAGGTTVESESGDANPEAFTDFEATTSGYYYYCVNAWTAPTPMSYTITWSKKTAPTTSMALVHTPTNPAYGSAARLTALLRYGTTPLSGKRVYFQRWTGSKWVNISSTSYANTDSYGKAYYNVVPYNNSKTIYRALFLSSGGYASASALRGVLPKVYLSTPAAPSSMTRGKSYAISGYLKPKHTAGTWPVRIYKYRYESGTWVNRGYHSARVSDYGSYSKYTGSVYLQGSGKWMLKAYAPTDTWHWATWSGYDLVTVP